MKYRVVVKVEAESLDAVEDMISIEPVNEIEPSETEPMAADIAEPKPTAAEPEAAA